MLWGFEYVGLDGETGKRFRGKNDGPESYRKNWRTEILELLRKVCVEERPYLKIRFAWEDGEQNCFRHYWRRTRRMQSC